ncbi:MAG TPA: hypothetical protein VFL13_14290 [Candidatus Baltobacteraceae bacterium]|nr:hypothetical protein [Candidatus Baltobacteraceae bacterium]
MFGFAFLAAVMMLPPDAPPQIVETHLSTSVVHPGETVDGEVVTSSNVASVVARVGTYAQPLQKVGVGRFRMNVRVPHLPFYMRGRWMVSFYAKNTAGVQVVTSLPITVR